MTVNRVDTQTGDTLTNSYALDGSQSKNGGMFSGGTSPPPNVATAKWDGKKLVITSTPAGGAIVGGGGAAPGGLTGSATTTIYMSGKQMRIETFRPGVNGASDTSILTFFNKKK